MIEVIVAFSVLVFVFGMLFQSLSLTGHILVRSRELRTEYRDLAGYYYLQGTGDGLIPEEGKSLTEWPAVLEFCLEENGDEGEAGEPVLKIPATIRRFQGTHASLYDAVPEKDEEQDFFENR